MGPIEADERSRSGQQTRRIERDELDAGLRPMEPSVRMPGPWIDPRPAYFIVGYKPAAS